MKPLYAVSSTREAQNLARRSPGTTWDQIIRNLLDYADLVEVMMATEHESVRTHAAG